MTNKMPLSYSRLNTFENCPAQFDYLYVSKTVSQAESEAITYGDRVHKVLEDYGRGDCFRELSDEEQRIVNKWGHLVDLMKDKAKEHDGSQLYFEYQMAVNERLEPVGWFDSDVYFRSIADVLIVVGDTAYMFDYKTGKVRDNPLQMQFFAAMVFWCFPHVEKVATSFLWLKFDQTSDAVYRRNKLGIMWEALKPRLDNVHDTIDLGVFDTRPSGLCPWCPAQDICPDARRRR